MKTKLERIVESLDFSAALLQPGDWRGEPSVWKVTLRRGGREFSTEFHNGSAHREWGKLRPGLGTIGAPWECMPFRFEETIDNVKRADASRPIPPTIEEVLYSLSSDVEFVRHGQDLDEFQEELGIQYASECVRAFNGCLDEWRGLTRLGIDLDSLAEAVQEWDEA